MPGFKSFLHETNKSTFWNGFVNIIYNNICYKICRLQHFWGNFIEVLYISWYSAHYQRFNHFFFILNN